MESLDEMLVTENITMRRSGLFYKAPEKLQEMLDLAKQGWGLSQLARKYECNHTTILHWLRKYNAPYPKKSTKQKIKKRFAKNHLFGERINEGKSYAEYVEESDFKYKALAIRTFRSQTKPFKE